MNSMGVGESKTMVEYRHNYYVHTLPPERGGEERERERDRQTETDRQRQTYRKTEADRDRETDRDRERDKQTEKDTDRETDRKIVCVRAKLYPTVNFHALCHHFSPKARIHVSRHSLYGVCSLSMIARL